MRELHSCDFCDSEAIGVYEALPSSVVAPGTIQQRVALCEKCQHLLESILSPMDETNDQSRTESKRVSTVSVKRETPSEQTETGVQAAVDEKKESAMYSEHKGSHPDEPEQFRTVMRLLANRNFPVEKSEIVDISSGAYDVNASQVNTIIEHAIDRGVLIEEKDMLKRPVSDRQTSSPGSSD